MGSRRIILVNIFPEGPGIKIVYSMISIVEFMGTMVYNVFGHNLITVFVR